MEILLNRYRSNLRLFNNRFRLYLLFEIVLELVTRCLRLITCSTRVPRIEGCHRRYMRCDDRRETRSFDFQENAELARVTGIEPVAIKLLVISLTGPARLGKISFRLTKTRSKIEVINGNSITVLCESCCGRIFTISVSH